MRSLTIIFCVLLVLFSRQQAQTRIIHVPVEQPTIQAGINVAVNGDTVLLADGTYTGVGNRYIDYHGKAITVMSESGNPDSCIIDCQKAGCGFLFESGEGSGSVLEGVTIKNGYHGVVAGGICCSPYSSPMLINITLLKNTGAHGGGLNCWGASPILTNVTFSKNQSETAGGGIYCEESSPTLTNVTFLENTAIWGGGMSCDSSPTLNNCTFSKNQAASGGGMYCTSDHATLTDCTFSLNWAWSDGGGMECWDSFSTLSNCTFFGNSSTYLWGIIYCGAGSCVTLLNTIIAFSTQGGAIGCDGASTASLTYCNVYGNAGGDWVACIAGQNTIPGNISCNPKFCYPDTGNFHLAENSCCVGAGCDSLGNPDTTIDIGAFEVDCSSLLPGPFSLLFPPSKAFTPRRVRLDWETATYPDTFDQVKYDLYISTSYRFHPDSTIIDSNLVPSEMVKNLDYGAHYWKVKAKDNGGGERWSNQIRYFMVTGIHYSGDFNGDGSTDVGDVVFAINYLYKSGSAPDPLDLGDTNCDGVVNAADVVYLINYLFIGGPPPCEP